MVTTRRWQVVHIDIDNGFLGKTKVGGFVMTLVEPHGMLLTTKLMQQAAEEAGAGKQVISVLPYSDE